ncbi:MAG: YndJ family protein [bacterium]|nr:YndJ family protein [bacterium]
MVAAQLSRLSQAPASLSFLVASSGCGLILWLLLPALIPERGIIGEIEHILRFAVFVLVPLELQFAANINRAGRADSLYAWLLGLYWPGAIGVAASFAVFSEPGAAAAIAVVPWLLLTFAGALLALRRLLARGATPVAELLIDLGWIYWPVGAIWLLASRLGFELMGFPGKIVILTAVHFHFAGLAAPLIVGLAGRYLEYRPGASGPARMYRLGALLVAAGIPLTALGIAASPLIEWIAAVAIVIGLALTMGLVLVRLVPRLVFSKGPAGFARRFAALLLGAAAGSVFVSMWFAFRFATGEYLGESKLAGAPVPIDAMVVLHGWWNALGFAGLGVIAFAILRPEMHRFRPGIPFSRLSSKGKVGRDFFERSGWIDDAPNASTPVGLVDDLQSYDGLDFSVARLHPDIREFYEHTDDFELSVTPRWRWFMLPAARLYSKLSSRLEQMNFPILPTDSAMTSRILPIRDVADGRSGVRAWVRHYDASGQAIYAAAYASHRAAGRTFMNIAFPVPGGNITSILRLQNLDAALDGKNDAGGIALTSRPHPIAPGDEGVYFANRIAPLRLPINETITVYTRDMPGGRSIACGGDLVAHHRMWLFGFVFLELEYCIQRKA